MPVTLDSPAGGAPDAVIAGAGLAGCAAAIHLARRGAHVVVLEPNPSQPRRFAGEWIHPPGVRQLRTLGVDFADFSHARGRGFAVFFEGCSEPVLLPYPQGEMSVSFEHSHLLAQLRARVHESPAITFVDGARLIEIDGTAVRYQLPGQDESRWVDCGLIVGADGRSSAVRRALGVAGSSSVVSYMAGLLVDDVDLIAEGFAHVLIGRPGPILIYRVAKRRVRICFDVPVGLRESCRTRQGLWSMYRDAFPVKLRQPVQMALEAGRVQWAANRLQRRDFFGDGGVALIGDAVGSTHPLSASGLTTALLDAECLARTGNVAAYTQERLATSRVPELVADALYRIVAHDDAGSATLRRGLNRVWRNDAALTAQTMQLLTTEETGLGAFVRIFLRGVAAALYEVGNSASRHDGGSIVRDVAGLAVWLKWLVANRRRRMSWSKGLNRAQRRTGHLWATLQSQGASTSGPLRSHSSAHAAAHGRKGCDRVH